MIEEWKDIPGYEGLYQASTLGKIRTCEGKTTSSARYKHRVWKQRIMKQKCTVNTKGRKDCRVDLWKGKEHKTWLVSRLVALTWCDGYRNGYTVNHKNGNHLDNRSENLEWITLKDNILHGFETGLYPTKPCALVSENGSCVYFSSFAHASKWLGKNGHYVSVCVSRNKKAKSLNGEIYEIKLLENSKNENVIFL